MGAAENLGLKILECNPEHFVTEIFVDNNLIRGYGEILHGGVSALIAEDIAGKAGVAALELENDKSATDLVGLNVTATHLLSVREGDTIRSVATPVRLGTHIQIWDVKQYRKSDNKLFNISRVENYVKRK